jgi:hypothetical protein
VNSKPDIRISWEEEEAGVGARMALIYRFLGV